MKAETTVDRRAKIRQMLEANNVVSSQQLAELFNVSLMTIYRDLDSLQEQGIAKRQHGGAILANRFVSARLRGKKANIHLDAKRAVGRYAPPYRYPRRCYHHRKRLHHLGIRTPIARRTHQRHGEQLGSPLHSQHPCPYQPLLARRRTTQRRDGIWRRNDAGKPETMPFCQSLYRRGRH